MFVNTIFLMYSSCITYGGFEMIVSQRLAEIRRKNNLSQIKVAEILNMAQQQYCRYENGQNEIPVRHIITLCKFYGVSADWLLGLKDTME